MTSNHAIVHYAKEGMSLPLLYRVGQSGRGMEELKNSREIERQRKRRNRSGSERDEKI